MEAFNFAKLDPPCHDSKLEVDPESIASARDTLIEVLVANGPASVRLSNAITQGKIAGKIPCQTVGDYLDAGPDAAMMFMRSLRNFGRLTARELDALVADHLAAASLSREACTSPTSPTFGVAHTHDARISTIIARLDGLTYTDALKGQVPSVRLANALANGLGARPVAELLTGGEACRAELLRRPNFGRTSLHELETLCRTAVIRTLAKECIDPQSLLADCALLFNGPAEGPHAARLAQQILETLEDQPPQNCGLDQLLDWAMPELPERELDILTRRYGLADREIETLEEISEGYHVTRERVRQLEAKALRRLRGKLDGTSLTMLVDQASGDFWTSRGTPFLVIASRDGSQLRRELPPRLALALDILDLSVGAWLERTSTPMSNGFLARSFDAETIRALSVKLQNRLKDQPLPIAVSDVLGDQDPSLVEAAVCLETPFVLFESYLLRDRPRARLKRAIRLHALLCTARHTQTLYELGDLYCTRFPADRCSLRDLVIVMELSPQLFLEIEEGLWVSLGQGSRPATDFQSDVEVDAPAEIDQLTIAGSIQEALRIRGPSLVGDLYRDGAAILPTGRSRNSIAPVLVGRPELFHRILPGVYALPEQLPSPAELLQAPLPYLLTEAQGRTYAFARLAGEPWGVFPLWSPAAEYRLCIWARFEGSPALFHSLLAISTIDVWPVDDVRKGEWHRLAALHGRFELAVAGKAPIQEVRPELDRLLAACLIASSRGSIGWLQINRIMGRRLDAAGGQGLLALMIALGVVTLPDGDEDGVRLRPHVVTEKALEIADQITTALIRQGELSWHSPLGHALAADAVAVAPERLGWASLDELAELLQTEPSEQIDATASDHEADHDEEDDDDLITRLMREHRRTVEQDRRDKAAQWLLEA